MTQWNRRDLLKGLAAASTAIVVRSKSSAVEQASFTTAPLEIQLTPIGAHTFRLSLMPIGNGPAAEITSDGSLVQESWGAPTAKLRADSGQPIVIEKFQVTISLKPVTIKIANEHGELIQQFDWDENTGAFSFLTGSSPLFGLGEGGPQFDR